MGSIPNNPDGFIPLPVLASVPLVAGIEREMEASSAHATVMLTVIIYVIVISASYYTYHRLHSHTAIRSKLRRIKAETYCACSSCRYPYIVQFVTGLRPGAGTYGSITFSVQGDRQSTPTYVIEPLTMTGRTVQRASTLTFVIHTQESIGEVQCGEVELVDEHAERWYLKYMTVIDPLLARQWYLPCHKWLRAGPQSTGKHMISSYNQNKLWRWWDMMTETFHCTSISPDRLDLRMTVHQANILSFIDRIFYMCVPAVAMFNTAVAIMICTHCASLTDTTALLAHVFPRCLVYNLIGDLVLLVSMLARMRLTPLSNTIRTAESKYMDYQRQQLMPEVHCSCPLTDNFSTPRSLASSRLPATRTPVYTPPKRTRTPKKNAASMMSPDKQCSANNCACPIPVTSASDLVAYRQQTNSIDPIHRFDRSRSPAKRVSAKVAPCELFTLGTKEPRRVFDRSASPANRVLCREDAPLLFSGQSADRSFRVRTRAPMAQKTDNNVPRPLMNSYPQRQQIGQHLCKKHRQGEGARDDDDTAQIKAEGTDNTATLGAMSQPTYQSKRGRPTAKEPRSNTVTRSPSPRNYTTNANILNSKDLSELNNDTLYLGHQRQSSPAGASEKSQASSLSRDTALARAITSNLKVAIRETSNSLTRKKFGFFAESVSCIGENTNENQCVVLNTNERNGKLTAYQNTLPTITYMSLGGVSVNDLSLHGTRKADHAKPSSRRICAQIKSAHSASGHVKHRHGQSSPRNLRDFTTPDGRRTVVRSLQNYLNDEHTAAMTNDRLPTTGERKSGKKSKQAGRRQTTGELTSGKQHLDNGSMTDRQQVGKPLELSHSIAFTDNKHLERSDRVKRFEPATQTYVSDIVESLSASIHKTDELKQLSGLESDGTKAGKASITSGAIASNQLSSTNLLDTKHQSSGIQTDQFHAKTVLQQDKNERSDVLKNTSFLKPCYHMGRNGLTTTETNDGTSAVSTVHPTSSIKQASLSPQTKTSNYVNVSHVTPTLPENSAQSSPASKTLPFMHIESNVEIPEKLPKSPVTGPLLVSPVSVYNPIETQLHLAPSKPRRKIRHQHNDNASNGVDTHRTSSMLPIIMTTQEKPSDALAANSVLSDQSKNCVTRVLKALDWPLGIARAVESYHSLSSVTPSVVSDTTTGHGHSIIGNNMSSAFADRRSDTRKLLLHRSDRTLVQPTSIDCFIAERLIEEAEAALEYTSESDASEARSACKNGNANIANEHSRQLLATLDLTLDHTHGDVSRNLLHVHKSLRDDIEDIASALNGELASSEHTSALTLAVTELILKKMRASVPRGEMCVVCWQPYAGCRCEEGSERQVASRICHHTHTSRLVLAILSQAQFLLTDTADTVLHDIIAPTKVALLPIRRESLLLSQTQNDICDKIFSLVVDMSCDSAVNQVTSVHHATPDKHEQDSSTLQHALTSFLDFLRERETTALKT